MFSLRVFQNKGYDCTNVHLKDFDDKNQVNLTRDDLKYVEKIEECIFQVYPFNTQKETFYTFPKGHGLYLFDLESRLLVGETKNHDQYIYFRLLPRESYRFVIIIAESIQVSRSLFAVSYTN